MKKMISGLLALMLVLSCLAVSAATLGVVRMPTSDGSVWLRSGGGTSYSKVGYAYHGDMLAILNTGNSWNRVTMRDGPSSGKTGWMYKKYITNLKSPSDMNGWGALAHIKTNYAASTVALRKGPGTRYAIKDYLNRNDSMIILNKYSSSWYEVQVVKSLRTGYVSKTYIANGAVGYTTANLNLRKSASTSAKILTTIPSGGEVNVINIGKYWSKVKYGSRTGYVSNGYLRLA